MWHLWILRSKKLSLCNTVEVDQFHRYLKFKKNPSDLITYRHKLILSIITLLIIE